MAQHYLITESYQLKSPDGTIGIPVALIEIIGESGCYDCEYAKRVDFVTIGEYLVLALNEATRSKITASRQHATIRAL